MADSRSSGGGVGDALAWLRAEHATIGQLFAQVAALCGSAHDLSEDSIDGDKTAWAAQIDALCEALSLHSRLEEELFYPALRRAAGDSEALDDATLAHAGIAELLSRLEVMYPGDAHFDATLSVLADEAAHHMAEEEALLFETALAADLDLIALGLALSERRAQLDVDLSAAPASTAAAHEGRRSPGRAPD